MLGYFAYCSQLKKRDGYSKNQIKEIAEKTSLYVAIGTIVGARLFDVLFYQKFSDLVHDPFEIIKFWQGGLASHGGVAGILVALFFLQRSLSKKYPKLTYLALLDRLVTPGLIAGVCIRIGNFFNQEILGTVSTLPWAIIFGHPADGSPILPRHPVQLYEALFYLILFAFFSKNWTFLRRQGQTVGLFFILCFSFRFLIEYVKAPQSQLLPEMGQLLSLPLILLGVFLLTNLTKKGKSG